MTHFLLKNFKFQIILILFTCLSLPFQHVNAQEDTMFIHLSTGVDFYPTSEVDSVTFHYGTTHVTDSMIIWQNHFSIAKYLVNNVDSISFSYSPTIFQPLIAYCEGIPMVHDLRDLSVYRTVKIGNQCWLRENLRYIPYVFSPNGTSNSERRYYVYDYYGDSLPGAINNQNYIRYGVLYNYPAAQAACPQGWRLPTNEEWDSLENYLITHHFNYDESVSENKIAKSLTGSTSQSNGGYWQNSNDAGTPGNTDFEWKRNLSGFSVLPGGLLALTGFLNIKMECYFWGSSSSTSSNENSRSIYFNHYGLNNDLMPKQNGLSVRCIAKSLFVQTENVTHVSYHEARLNGTIESGAVPTIEKGFYWKKNTDSTWTKNVVQSDSLFLNLTNLDSLSTYHYFAFVSSITETKYGDTLSFISNLILPTPKIPRLLHLDHNRATFKFEYIEGSYPITSQWYRYRNIDSVNWNIISYNNNQYIDTLLSLVSGKVYEIGNIVTCLSDTIYSTNLRFITSLHTSCPGYETFMDTRDSSYYSTVLINGTCWMKENLRYIPSVVPPNNNSETIPYYYVYGYYGTNLDSAKLSENYTLFGTLYNPKAALNGFAPSNQKPSLVQGVCPDGWFLPSKAEWDALHSYLKEDGRFHIPNLPNTNVIKSCVGTSTVSNGGMWNISTEHGSPGNSDFPDKRDLSGLSVLPGGCISASEFAEKGSGTYFWTSAQNFSDFYYVINYRYNFSILGTNAIFLDSDYASYVRCVKHSKSIAYTTGVTNVSASSVTIKGKIIKGLGTLLSQGFMWKPVEDTVWNTVLVSGDTISHTLNNLDSASVFEYKVFVLTTTDTTYSLPQKFYTLGTKHCPNMPTITDSRDSSVYNTIQVGDQCWLKENLRYLPKVTYNNTISSNDTLYYVYNYNDTIVANAKLTNNYIRYGVLYNLNSVKTNVCPEGWVVPYQSNWDTLQTFLIKNGYNYNGLTTGNKVAKSLSGSENSANGGYWINSSNIGTPGNTDFPDYRNRTQLSFIPGGYITGGIPLGIDSVAQLWSYNPNLLNYSTMEINYNSDSIKKENAIYNDANYIRCVQYNPAGFDISVNEIKSTTVRVLTTNHSGTIPSPFKNIKYKIVSNTNWQQSIGANANFTLPNLTPNSNYVIIGYYLYYKDTIWSAPCYFTTAPAAHTFSTITVTNITSTSATASLTVTSGTQAVLTRGIQYQAHDSNVWISISSTSNSIAIPINNLTPNTYYRVRGYASDSTTTYYSNYVTFMTTSAVSNPNTNSNRRIQK